MYQQVAEDLALRIREGDLKSQFALPSENDLARDYGVSRNVMREALVALEIMGLVTVRAGAGAFVNEAARNQLPVSLSGIAEAAGPSPLAILSARKAIEGEIAAIAASVATDADLAHLTSIIAAFEDGGQEGLGPSGWPGSFHIGLAQATHNPVFVAVMKGIWQAVEGPMFEGLRSHVELRALHSRLETRKAILKRIQARDSDGARRAMHRHLDMVIKDLFGEDKASQDIDHGCK